MRKLRFGAINWDCSLPSDTYFGYYQARNLSPKKFRSLTPYYADILGEDEITYHYRSAEEFDRELRYAIEAGIDYFAYVWYGEEASHAYVPGEKYACTGHVYELNWARHCHIRSALRDQIGLCAILSGHPYTDGDLRELAEAMREPCYERIDGRPLVYSFKGCDTAFYERLRAACAAAGVPSPYLVAFYVWDVPEPQRLDGVNALAAYAFYRKGVDTYAELMRDSLEAHARRLKTGCEITAHFTTGINTAPRDEQPSPWNDYSNLTNVTPPAPEEWLTAAEELAEWLRDEAAERFNGHVLTYAWNEFEEGGYICPTVDADGAPDMARVRIFKAVTEKFREILS